MTRTSSTPARGLARKGSQRLLQVAVNSFPEILNVQIRQALNLPAESRIDWLSPLARDGYREYKDDDFVSKLGIALSKRPLSEFWPAGGPRWDGLGMAGQEYLFIEAKAHIAELVTTATRATGRSRRLIERSLREVQQSIAPKSTLDWTTTFYQYTNRLALLHFLRTVNRVRARLLNVYFVNAPDIREPVTSRAEWEGALKLLKCYLGIRSHALSKYSHDIFVDADALTDI